MLTTYPLIHCFRVPICIYPGRLITDNVLVAYELNHYLAHKTWGSVRHADPKLDLSKAYDCVEWNFLATRDAMFRVEWILRAFEEASGLIVNLEKSLVAFSRNTSYEIQANLANILGVRVVAKQEKYLGLPAFVRCSEREVFQAIRGKVWKRLQSWKCINLSQAGKLVLLKSIVQAMPTFVMGCFLIPTTLCRELESMMADFVWHNIESRRVHWISWDNYMRGRKRVVLGFRGCSFTWCNILASRELIKAGLQWHIGSGRSARIWKDRWIPRLCFTLPEDATVDKIIDDVGGRNEALISEFFRTEDVGFILEIVRSAGGLFVGTLKNMGVSQLVVRLFAWRDCHDALPTSSKLASCGLPIEGECLRCGDEGEDLMHVLLVTSLTSYGLCLGSFGPQFPVISRSRRTGFASLRGELLERIWGLENSIYLNGRLALALEDSIKQLQIAPFNPVGIG
ncbi:UNVERIFIED_CONTAM: hypothetical protein Sradi_3978700 [Sesamum radiatum]|uniref:Reverse transcriptase zinc-binding domain-containing protein n=1 Tax=Sesamum radiatum TaxID=300843 RepID=A0AAW2PHX0_SESRA